jgi:uncharacterized circularly permuted ATP-grasp superfamily protein/uncharacterized alpha-E superfamily protein
VGSESNEPREHSPNNDSAAITQNLSDYFDRLRPAEINALDERMEATLREMGVSYGATSGEGSSQRWWTCDLRPEIFSAGEWSQIRHCLAQRLQAFELFLQDVYGRREILRQGLLPIHAVLASPCYQSASIGIPQPRSAYLHIGALCITRLANGGLAVKEHWLSRAPGISFMMQNRRALARVVPGIFRDAPVYSVAETPQLILEGLRNAAPAGVTEPAVVLLTPGSEAPIYFEHGFLARRMGIPLVEGGDLLVLDDAVHLKTVQGLKRVDVIYNQVPDANLDPLVFRKESRFGVPGLVHCLRRGTVTVINGIGSQLADDRALLGFASKIIRFYLSEDPALPTVPTFWLGDIDQLEMVLANLDRYQIRPVCRDTFSLVDQTSAPEKLQHVISNDPGGFVAQRVENGDEPIKEHIVFGERLGQNFAVFPGALTRIFDAKNDQSDAWISRDSWVLGESPSAPPADSPQPVEAHLAARHVTSRVAEAFYWMGRYLERAHHQAYLIQAIETLETEELNAAERKMYRPMWNRLLPPLETSAGEGRRSITTRRDRYRLVVFPQPGSVARTLDRAIHNAESVLECLSPEAWATLTNLRSRFQRVKYRENLSEEEFARIARRLSESVTQLIPQFFSIAGGSMLADDGWRFCKAGQMLERAITTANSSHLVYNAFLPENYKPSTEIELSAFLRLLGTRDAYRRVYQARAEPIAVMSLLWQNLHAPRSILRCLNRCAGLLRESVNRDTDSDSRTVSAIEELAHRIALIDWAQFIHSPAEDDTHPPAVGATDHQQQLEPLLRGLLANVLEIHHLISDDFLSHQSYISQTAQSQFAGF